MNKEFVKYFKTEPKCIILAQICTNPVTSEMEERAMQPLCAAVKEVVKEIPLKVTQSLQPQMQRGKIVSSII